MDGWISGLEPVASVDLVSVNNLLEAVVT